MPLAEYLATLPGRCSHGYAEVQHPTLCDCDEHVDEWATFRRAFTAIARANDGVIRQSEMRKRIRGHIDPPHIGGLYTRAKAEHLIHVDGYERSDDRPGKNAGRLEPRYRLGPKPELTPHPATPPTEEPTW